MTREQSRQLFDQSGLSYSDIGSMEIAKLIVRIKEELKRYDNNGFTMQLNENPRLEFKEDGSVKLVELRCKGILYDGNTHFESREAITFNNDGFIGFCGWADRFNVQPFLKAFNHWLFNMRPELSYKE